MSVNSTREAVMAYLSAEHEHTSMLDENVVFTLMSTGEETHGIKAIQDMLFYFYHVALEATVQPRTLVFGEENAVLEGMVVGTHTGEFAGVPATGKEINVPIVVVYDLFNDKIAKARIYFEIPVFLKQVGAA